VSLYQRIKRANELDPECEWRSRGYLPHFDGSDVVQFITYRLADSLSSLYIRQLKSRLNSGHISEIEYHRDIEKYLDMGQGEKYLEREDVAVVIEENLLRFDREKYQLLHWVIMPNHVHLLLRPIKGHFLSSIIHSMKSFTANRANNILGSTGRFWSVDYFDRYIRSEAHYNNVVTYIHDNPVKAGLCESNADWHFGCVRNHE